MSSSQRPRSFLLIEMLLVLIPGMILLGLLAKMTGDFITLQRQAGEHASRMAVSDSLCTRMRQDILAAGNADWMPAGAAGLLVLHSPGAAPIAYHVEATYVSRWVGDAQDTLWSSRRLEFRAGCDSGRAARLLKLTLLEIPPPRSTVLAPRRFETTFVLPPAAGDGKGAQP